MHYLSKSRYSFLNKSKSIRGAAYLIFVVFLALIIGFILISAQLFELLTVKRVGTTYTTSKSILAAESALYSTIQQIKTSYGWPTSKDFQDKFNLGNSKITRKINLLPGGTTVIDIQSEYLGTRRRLIAEFKPSETKKSFSGNPTDLIMVIDRSSSMRNPSSKFTQAIVASKTLVDYMDPDRDQVGVVFFDKNILWISPLTNDLDFVRSELNKVNTGSGTHILEGLYEGHKEALSTRIRSDANQIIVILSDGKANVQTSTSPCNTAPGDLDDRIICEANMIKAEGITIYSIAYGSDADVPLMKAIASGADYYFYAPNPPELVTVSNRIGNSIISSSTFTIREEKPY